MSLIALSPFSLWLATLLQTRGTYSRSLIVIERNSDVKSHQISWKEFECSTRSRLKVIKIKLLATKKFLSALLVCRLQNTVVGRYCKYFDYKSFLDNIRWRLAPQCNPAYTLCEYVLHKNVPPCFDVIYQ